MTPADAGGADDPLLDDTLPLHPGNAAAAILLLPGPRYLLQLRDRKRGIFFPGLWGCFGGALEPGEDVPAALARELREELDLTVAPDAVSYFTNYTFDMAFCGAGVIFRTFYEVRIAAAEVSRLKLSEGSAVQAFSPAEIFGGLRLVPYDAFALWMHISRSRLHGPADRPPD